MLVDKESSLYSLLLQLDQSFDGRRVGFEKQFPSAGDSNRSATEEIKSGQTSEAPRERMGVEQNQNEPDESTRVENVEDVES